VRGTLGVHLILALVPVMWGLNFLFTQELLAHWAPLAFLVARFGIMTVAALIWAAAARDLRPIARADWWPLAVAGLFGIAIYQLCFVFSLERTTVFASSLLASIFPLFTMIAAAAMGEERPSALRWGGALVAFAGIAVFEGLLAGKVSFKPGDLLALLASLAFAPYTLVVRRLRTRYSPIALLAYTMSAGTAVLLALGAVQTLHADYSRLTAHDWLLFGYVIIFPVLIGYALLNWGIARIGAGPATMYAFGVPIVGGVASHFAQHAPIEGYEFAGTALCIGGLVIAQVAGERRAST
jgi:drug/metabolite transporter (DMT)-like permease